MKTLQPNPGVIARHLAALPVFKGLDPGQLDGIAAGSRLCMADKEERLFWTDAPAEILFGVVQGAVRVFRWDADGREKVIHLLKAPALVAEVPVLMGGAFPSDAVCSEDSQLVVIPRRALIEAIRSDPELPMHMLGAAFGRMRELTRSLVTHGQKNAVTRVAAYLLGLSHGSDEVQLPSAKKDVANYLGLQPESFSRALATLKRRGAITVLDRTVQIEDRAGLESFLTSQ